MRHRRRKITWALLLTFTFIQLIVGGGSLPTAKAQLDSYVVAFDTAFPPFAWKNDQGELEGFDIDLMNAITAEAGLKLHYETIQFRYLLTGVVSRLYDIGAGCIFANPEREKLVNFSKPYFMTGDVLIVQSSNTTIQQPSDLTAEMTVGVVQGTLGEQYGQTHTQALLISLTSITDAFTELDIGTLNAVIADEESLLGYQQEHPEANLKIVGDLLTYQECGFAIEKSNTDLLLKLNAALEELKNKGIYEKIYSKWFGSRPIYEKPIEAAPEVVNGTVTSTENGVTNSAIPAVSTDPILANSDILTLTPDTVAGIYYLNISTGAPSSSASFIAAPSYQIVTLAVNGLWFSSQLGATLPDQPPTADNSQNDPQNNPPGVWWVNDQQQIEATQLLFGAAAIGNTNSDNATEVLRQSYQMTMTAEGMVTGSYTAATYAASDFAQSPAAIPITTQRAEFTGRRVR